MKHLSNVQQPPKVESNTDKAKSRKGWKWIKIILFVLRLIQKYVLQDDDFDF